MVHTHLGGFLALAFVFILGSTLFWMMRLPRPMTQEVARAVFSVEAARCIVVPILDLFYSERAVELASRMGSQQNAMIVLAYVVEVPRLLSLDTPPPAEVQERAAQAFSHGKSIAELHGLKSETTLVPAREASEGIVHVVQTYRADIVVLGMRAVQQHVPGIFARTAEALLRRPPCEVLIDSMPG